MDHWPDLPLQFLPHIHYDSGPGRASLDGERIPEYTSMMPIERPNRS